MFKYKPLYICLLLCCILNAQDKDTLLIKLNRHVTEATTDSLKVEAYLELGRYQLRRDFNLVESYLNKVLKIINRPNETYDSRLHKAKVKQQLGIIYRKRADYVQSLNNYYEALLIFETMHDSIGLASSYHNIGTVLIYEKEFKKGKKNLKKSIDINAKLGRKKSLANNYNMLALLYKKTNNSDSILYFYDKALKAYKSINYEEGVNQVAANISNLLIKVGQYNEALELQLKNLEYATKIQKKTTIASSNYNLASIYIKLKNYDKALKHINASMEMSKKEKMGRRLGLSYKRRSLIYRDTKKYYEALEDYRRYSKIFDSVYNLNKVKEIREIELSYKFDKERALNNLQFQQEKKILILQAEKETFRKRMYLSLIILASLIGYIGVNYFRKRWKISKRLQEELVDKLNLTKEESNKKLNVLNSEVEGLNSEIETRKEEITVLMTESLRHLKTKERLVGDLKKLASNDDAVSIQNIISDLKSEAIEDSRLMTIKNHLEELNYDFFKKIKEKHPNLTKVDLEICSYLRLSLERKEIARLRFTSVVAVKKSRNRLRKKMKLSLNDNLEDYIKSI